MRKARRHQKYNNTKVTRGGELFDSKKEARMYATLQRLQAEGKIKELVLKPEYLLIPRFEIIKKGKVRISRPCTYTPDYQFFDIEQNRLRVIDCKGFRDATYLLKKKMFDWFNKEQGLYIEENI